MEQLQQVLINLAILVIPVVGTFIVTYLKKKNAELNGKIENDNIEKYLNILFTAVETSVVAVQNEYVDSLKKDGKFDKDAQAEAFEDAKDRVLTILGENAVKTLNSACGDLEVFVNGLIEKSVKNNKQW